MAAAQASGRATIATFCEKLASELEGKFATSPVNELCLQALAASLDPRSRALAFLTEDDALQT